MTYGWVSFTTDYGTVDGFVAACKGVLVTVAPEVRVIDVTHQVPPQDVRRGAAVLAQAAPWLPEAVHLAVIDPGVGTDRLGVALVTPRGLLVGPDNGLLVPAAVALGGISAAYELADPAYHLAEVSRTFHGRDVFAPVAAHLCRGLDPTRLGPEVDPGRLVTLAAPEVAVTPGRVRADVLAVDRFGNVQLAATVADLDSAGLDTARLDTARLDTANVDTANVDTARLDTASVDNTSVDTARLDNTSHDNTSHDNAGVGKAGLADAGPRGATVTVNDCPATLGRTFADAPAGELVVLVDSDGQVAVAVNGGDAAAVLGTRPGDRVTVAITVTVTGTG